MRRLPADPSSALALWARRVALLGLAVAAMGLGLVQLGAIQPTIALVVLGAGWLMAAAAMLLAVAGLLSIWRHGMPGAGAAGVALVVAAGLLAPGAWFAFRAIDRPLLNDVASDPGDAPSFSRSRAALAARGQRVPEAYDERLAPVQRRAYPDIRPLRVEADAAIAMALAIEAAGDLGWRIIEQVPPGGPAGTGRVEAVARSPLLRFEDDITIRIRPLAGETRIDLRSRSRVGRHDLGANADRLRAFAKAFRARELTR